MSIQISLSDEAAESLWWLIKNQLEGSRTPLWTIEESAEMDKIMDRITKPVDNRVQAKRTRKPWPGETAAGFESPVAPMAEYLALQRDYDNLAALARSFVDRFKERDTSWRQTAESTQRVGEIIEDSLRSDNDALRQRLATLEAAARAVCEATREQELEEAVDELERVLGEVE